MLKKFTQKEFNEPQEIDGVKQCPTGDYTEIKNFPEWCFFGWRCSFGEDCSFGKGCSFGEQCSFGWRCSFGEQCFFSQGCSFGKGCSFRERCAFGGWCSFGERCSFGGWCSFEKGYEVHPEVETPFIAIDRVGEESRKTYFWLFEKGLYVRGGCFFGPYDEWLKAVRIKYGPDSLYERLGREIKVDFDALADHTEPQPST